MDQNELNEEKELKQVCETIDNKKWSASQADLCERVKVDSVKY